MAAALVGDTQGTVGVHDEAAAAGMIGEGFLWFGTVSFSDANLLAVPAASEDTDLRGDTADADAKQCAS